VDLWAKWAKGITSFKKGISEGTKELEEEATVVKAEAAEAAKDVTPTPDKAATPAPDKDKV
jgi:sec-independent protein translocase protein TatA